MEKSYELTSKVVKILFGAEKIKEKLLAVTGTLAGLDQVIEKCGNLK